jgi:hypothetical protein
MMKNNYNNLLYHSFNQHFENLDKQKTDVLVY